MGTPYLAELRIVSFNFAPKGWAMCNGQFLPINQNQALFSLLGTMYGGNGQTTFALPDLRGRLPMHVGSGHTQGEAGGSEAVTLSLSQLPAHTHFVNGTGAAADTANPTNAFWASGGQQIYSTGGSLAAMAPQAVPVQIGGSQPHENRSPILTLNFIIALIGVFPSRN